MSFFRVSAEMLAAWANVAGIERLATGLLRVMAATRTFPFSCETPSTGLKGGDRAGSKEKSPALGWAKFREKRTEGDVERPRTKDSVMRRRLLPL